jgi:hypothetical protein
MSWEHYIDEQANVRQKTQLTCGFLCPNSLKSKLSYKNFHEYFHFFEKLNENEISLQKFH